MPAPTNDRAAAVGLMRRARWAALATALAEPAEAAQAVTAGWPYASLVTVACDWGARERLKAIMAKPDGCGAIRQAQPPGQFAIS